jgi:hypothetical protein
MVMKNCAFLGMLVGVGFVALQMSETSSENVPMLFMFGVAWAVSSFLVFATYCLPIHIAVGRRHPQTTPIAVLALMGGWLAGIPWVIALVWALSHPAGVTEGDESLVQASPAPSEEAPSENSDPLAAIKRLGELMEAGLITEQEYEDKKSKLLDLV